MKHTDRDARSGRYRLGPECELCGLPAGHSYYSLGSPDPYGLVLCARRSCIAQRAGKTDDEIKAAIRERLKEKP